jgi:Cu(I)/Ag(I) efflux system membrane fusion protein
MAGIRIAVIGLLVLASLLIGWWFGQRQGSTADADGMADRHLVGAKQAPLYWVAPMDPNYRSDRPGKSPMGMDLVPVYAEDGTAGPSGSVRVSPDVQHNLGVRLAPVERGVLETPLRSVGFVEFDEAQVAHIHTRVDGWIQALSISDAGEPVTKGQELFTLYSPALIKAQEDYLLARTGPGASLRGASRDRLRALGISSGQISRIEKQGVADQSVAILADRDGVVGRLNVRAGMYVKPDLEVMSIGVLDRVWVTVELFERESVFVEPGQDVVMQLDYLPGRRWRAKVGYVYPVLDVATRTVRVRMVLDNSDGLLKPGMFGEVTIFSRSAKEVLSIPREALIRGAPVDRVVLALGDGRFRSQAVTVGREAGGRVEILAGLGEGTTVVTSSQFLIDSESSRDADFARMSSESVEQTGTGATRHD